jgi:hypothetical protein
MNFRTARAALWPITGLAAASGLALLLAASPVSAQGTPEQRAACEPDAMRLCGEFVPDVERIKACMYRKRAQLTPACRVYFGGGGKKKKAKSSN